MTGDGKLKLIAFGMTSDKSFFVYTRKNEEVTRLTRREYLDAVMREQNGNNRISTTQQPEAASAIE